MAEKLIPLEDAQSIVLSHVAPTDLVEIPVWQAAGLPLEMCIRDSSTTKYMDGHAAYLGGVIVDHGQFDWMAHADKFTGLTTPDESYHGVTYAEKFGQMCIRDRPGAHLRDGQQARRSAFSGHPRGRQGSGQGLSLIHSSLAGTSYPLDRQMTAAELGLAGVIPNSLDAVSDRDFLLDLHYAGSVMAMHLSRLSEEIL